MYPLEVVVLLLWVAFTVLATTIGSSKGRGELGFVLGFFFGAGGCIIRAVLEATPEARARQLAAPVTRAADQAPNAIKACRDCHMAVPLKDPTCPHCGCDFVERRSRAA